MARVGVLLLLLCAVMTLVAAQDAPSTTVQAPGVLDRLMQDYVYPLREYDWMGAFRRMLSSVMNYAAAEDKEPKSGHPLRAVMHLLTAALDARPASPPAIETQEQGRLLLAYLKGYGINTNDNVSPELAAHSWDYLGYLWLYAGMTILGALWPLAKFIPEEELLYPDYDFDKARETEQNYYDYDPAEDADVEVEDDYSYNYQSSIQAFGGIGKRRNTYNTYKPAPPLHRRLSRRRAPPRH